MHSWRRPTRACVDRVDSGRWPLFDRRPTDAQVAYRGDAPTPPSLGGNVVCVITLRSDWVETRGDLAKAH